MHKGKTKVCRVPRLAGLCPQAGFRVGFGLAGGYIT